MRKFIKENILIFIFLAVWISGSYFSLWNSYIIPYPEKVLNTWIKLLKNGILVQHILISFSRIFFGFFLTVTAAVPLAVFFGMFPKIYSCFRNTFEFIRHTPPLALIPMIILWFGIGELSKIIIIILASFFPVFLNTLKGIEMCDKRLIEVGQSFNFTKFEIFRKIILPGAVPDIVVGMKLGFGYSWRAIIGAEMIAASSGLGYLILDGQQISRSDIVAVGILTIGVLGIFTDLICEKIISCCLRKRGACRE